MHLNKQPDEEYHQVSGVLSFQVSLCPCQCVYVCVYECVKLSFDHQIAYFKSIVLTLLLPCVVFVPVHLVSILAHPVNNECSPMHSCVVGCSLKDGEKSCSRRFSRL